jgi:glycogen debranching enzyme
MNEEMLAAKVNAVIPGTTAAYASLRAGDGMGLHTSNGSFYNHTIFGRDSAMAAKFVSDFDHALVRETILSLARLQGTKFNTTTQEEPGRIHHELRDFRTWHGTLFERLPFWLMRRKWAIHDRRLLTYFALDTTATFIRLVHKYATHIDEAILAAEIINQHGETRTVQDAVIAAAGWISERVDDRDLIGEVRHNPWSLPFQTFQDSLYARADRSMADCNEVIVYVEVQALAADALLDADHLFPDVLARGWRDLALRMHQSMLERFDSDDGYLASAIDSRGQIDVPNVSVGWTLNTLLWDAMPVEEQAKRIGDIVERLFSDEFLTAVGLRSRARMAPEPVYGTIDYHGSETVWPMFGFMVVEGLRRHRLYQLAEQLEVRLINGLNALGDFPEFLIVQRDGTLVIPAHEWKYPGLNVQMKPEQQIAFSVVPALVMARRHAEQPVKLTPKKWQRDLETRLLSQIPSMSLAAPDQALGSVGPLVYRRLRRWPAGIATMYYFWNQQRKLRR